MTFVYWFSEVQGFFAYRMLIDWKVIFELSMEIHIDFAFEIFCYSNTFDGLQKIPLHRIENFSESA